MSGPEERRHAVDLYSATPMTTAQVVEHLAYPTRQCLERWPAKDPGYAGHMAKPIIPLETRTKAIEPVPGGMRQKQAAERLGAGLGAVRNRVRTYREGGMAALRPENRDAGQADKPAMRRDRSAGDAEAPRRRVEEPELGNAVMQEVVEAFAASRGRYGYRRVRALLRTDVLEKALRRIMAEDGLTAHVPKRRGYGSYEGETTPAPGSLADRDFTAGMPNGKWPADITRNQGRGREGRVSRRRSAATMAGSSRTRPVPVPTRTLADRTLVKAAETPPERGRIPWCIPTADATAGGPDGWRSWTATARRGRRVPKAVPRTTPRRGSSGV